MTAQSRKIQSEKLSPKTISNDSWTFSDNNCGYRNGKYWEFEELELFWYLAKNANFGMTARSRKI